MNKHTPGPWEVIGAHIYTKRGAENRAGSRAHESDGWNIATVNPWACTNSDGEDEDMPVSEVMANADILATSPDLLEALEAAMAFIESHVADPDLTADMRAKYAALQDLNPAAVIARARGEA